MTDRLSQIWGGFARQTSLDLSGTTVDTTPRPELTREPEVSVSYGDAIRVTQMPDGLSDPVSAALTAMQAQMTEKAKGGRRSKADYDATVASFRELPEAAIEKTLFADIAFTRSKTERRATDYISYAASRQVEWQGRKKKWFFGLF